MKLSGLLGSRQEALPGVIGTARIQRHSGDLPRRVGSGDIVVLDQADIDRRTAEALVAADVAAVVNTVGSISGKYPNLGPEVLLAAGIPLVDGVGTDVLYNVKDGGLLRLCAGVVYTGGRQGENEIACGVEQDANSIATQMRDAKEGMSAQLEAFSANTIEFLRGERMLMLDGIGVPEVSVPLADRHVLVVAPGYGHVDDLKRLRRYIREYQPTLIGVDGGADTLLHAGHKPDVIVGDPEGVDVRTLRSADEVVIPAHLDGFAPGLERIQDLGIGAVTFPASGNPEDLALLLADTHGARLVVTVGFQATLNEFLDRGRSGSNPSTFLTRLRLGGKIVDGSAVVALQRNRVPAAAVTLLIVAVFLAMFVALTASGLGGSYISVLAEASESVAQYLGGLFP